MSETIPEGIEERFRDQSPFAFRQQLRQNRVFACTDTTVRKRLASTADEQSYRVVKTTIVFAQPINVLTDISEGLVELFFDVLERQWFWHFVLPGSVLLTVL